MKTLYLDCGMGAAGDMLTAALLELLPDPDAFLQEINSLGLPSVQIKKELSVKCGIKGTHITITVDGQEEISDLSEHSHEHEHNHEHDPAHTHIRENGAAHTHHGLRDIEHMIGHLSLSAAVRADISAVYRLIAEAESQVHGVPMPDIHFHEVGTMDALADITAVCLLMEKIAPAQVIVSPVHVGGGHVRCAHGILPVPAPATAYILREAPIYGGGVKGELCTPTGAALLKHFATRFGEMPVMKVQAIGYGMGKKDFEAANCVRAMLGETENTIETVAELCCTLDDMTPEAIGFAMERFFEAAALDVYTVPVGMKKSRPGALLCVMCKDSDKDAMVRLMFRHTTTLGVRENRSRRYTLNRTVFDADTPLGIVRKKQSEGYGIKRSKYEYEDIARIAREQGMGLAEVLAKIEP